MDEFDEINQQRVAEYLAKMRKIRVLFRVHSPMLKKLEKLYGNG